MNTLVRSQQGKRFLQSGGKNKDETRKNHLRWLGSMQWRPKTMSKPVSKS